MILEKSYIDENVSGSTFKRYAFEEMIQDIETGKINCLICKDLSRFSRNLLGTGYYIEKYFLQHEVRFIAINNQFDTINDIYQSDEHGNLKKDFRIQSMLDEAVTHDISTKVSTNLNELARQGLFIAPRAPFGYKKINKHKLGIDPMAALVVKRIFKFASEGVGLTENTRTLSEECVLTPMEYAISNGAKGNYNTGTGKWSTRTIKDILVNITYVGHLCQGKDKITALNTHDAIIE